MKRLSSLETEILELKEKHNALILAHFYEDGEIQEIADFVGDSYFLAKKGQESQADVILLAGVVFMGESVKILNPGKTVLVPDLNAGCSLVQGSPYNEYYKWRAQHPHHICMTYINSSAAVKTITDVVCTSSNAEKILNAIPKDRPILFGPDENLGRYLSKKYNREMEFWPGACEVHILFSEKKLYQLKLDHPNAVVVAHPECHERVLQHADIVGSTSRLIDEVCNNPATEFIVATEAGIFHEMKKLRPEATLIQAPAEGSCACNECPYMKLNTLEKVRDALKTLEPQVHLEPELIEKARIPLERMMAVSRGESVDWPVQFEEPSQINADL